MEQNVIYEFEDMWKNHEDVNIMTFMAMLWQSLMSKYQSRVENSLMKSEVRVENYQKNIN